MEFEVDKISDYFDLSNKTDSDSRVYNAMEGYQDLIIEGHREIFRVE
jgi:hypothetical protein